MHAQERGLRDEGLIARALKGSIDGSARFIAKQDLFDGPDDAPVNEVAKANTITAIRLLSQRELRDADTNHLVSLALEAKTKGQLRDAIDATCCLLEVSEPGA